MVSLCHDHSNIRCEASRFQSFALVRAEGIEPSSQAWEAHIIAFILRPPDLEQVWLINIVNAQEADTFVIIGIDDR